MTVQSSSLFFLLSRDASHHRRSKPGTALPAPSSAACPSLAAGYLIWWLFAGEKRVKKVCSDSARVVRPPLCVPRPPLASSLRSGHNDIYHPG